jgi:hypothetical protein
MTSGPGAADALWPGRPTIVAARPLQVGVTAATADGNAPAARSARPRITVAGCGGRRGANRLRVLPVAARRRIGAREPGRGRLGRPATGRVAWSVGRTTVANGLSAASHASGADHRATVGVAPSRAHSTFVDSRHRQTSGGPPPPGRVPVASRSPLARSHRPPQCATRIGEFAVRGSTWGGVPDDIRARVPGGIARSPSLAVRRWSGRPPPEAVDRPLTLDRRNGPRFPGISAPTSLTRSCYLYGTRMDGAPPPQPPSTPVSSNRTRDGHRFDAAPTRRVPAGIGCRYHAQATSPRPICGHAHIPASDTATARGLSTLHAVAWVSAAAVGCLALVVRFRRA